MPSWEILYPNRGKVNKKEKALQGGLYQKTLLKVSCAFQNPQSLNQKNEDPIVIFN